MEDLEKSELIVAKILEKLFERGLQEGGVEFNDLGLEEGFLPFFNVSVRWLKSEGLIRFDSFNLAGGYKGMRNPTLTSRGFKAINGVTLIGSTEMPTKEVVKEVASQSGRWSQIGEFTGSLLGSFTKSVSS